jgi:integration host factor subunit alpha
VSSSRTSTVTRADLATAVYAQAKISRAESLELVEMMLSEIDRTLSRGEDVKLASFGAFVVRAKGERIGRNPKTGVETPIAARRVVMFKASQSLRDRVSGNSQQEGTRATKGRNAFAMRRSA